MAERYRIKHPETVQDYEKLYTIMEKSFSDEDVAGIVKRFVQHHPEMNKDDYFLAMGGDEAVAGLVLIPQTWSIGGVNLRVAEMGCVGTIPEYRKKGAQRALNKWFDRYAREKGYDLCVLAGIPYFYRHFGYQYAVELDYTTSIKVEKLPEGEKPEYRPFKDEDTSEASKLLEKTQEKYMVKSLRTPEIWEMQEKTGTYGAEPFKGTTILEEGAPIAYYRWWPTKESKTLKIKELAMINKGYAPRVASVIREEAAGMGLEKISTKLSHLDDFSIYLTNLGAEKNKPYAWQVKILNPRDFLEKLGPVFEKRIADSEFNGLNDKLYLNFWKYGLALKFRDGKLVSVKQENLSERKLGLNPYASIQLFLGYRSREDLEYAYPDFYIRGGYERLFDVLFPRAPGYIHYCY